MLIISNIVVTHSYVMVYAFYFAQLSYYVNVEVDDFVVADQ